MLNPHFVILGAVIAFAGNLNYLLNVLRGRTRPNRISWMMWALAPMVIFAAQIHAGVGLRSLMTFVAGFNPLTIFIASFVNKKAVWKLTKFDFACGAFSLIGLALWAISGEGNIAILLSIIADGLAALPTIAKSYSHPDSESWLNYFAAGIGGVITLLTIKTWNFANYGFPVYLVIVCLLIASLVKFRWGLRLSAPKV